MAASNDERSNAGEALPDDDDHAPEVYELFRAGTRLLESDRYAQAIGPLEKAKRLEPDKTSIREALGRAYFRAGSYGAAAREFRATVERCPVNDYAHFCLGRSLQKMGRTAAARRHFALASNLRPDRPDYRRYRQMLSHA